MNEHDTLLDVRYKGGEAPLVGDRIYAAGEDFITVVRSIHGTYLKTAGWPECMFQIKDCAFVERGVL